MVNFDDMSEESIVKAFHTRFRKALAINDKLVVPSNIRIEGDVGESCGLAFNDDKQVLLYAEGYWRVIKHSPWDYINCCLKLVKDHYDLRVGRLYFVSDENDITEELAERENYVFYLGNGKYVRVFGEDVVVNVCPWNRWYEVVKDTEE